MAAIDLGMLRAASASANTSPPAFTTVSAKPSLADHLGAWKVRWGIGRMNFRVVPGLYATGKPNQDSPVFVTGIYQMSFDLLRQALAGLDAWIVALDTKGVNVWCAAGKGTFGTQELVQRLVAVRLAEAVRHRRLILPQLGAVGVSAPQVKALSGFTVVWGPVRAADIPAWLAAGQRKTPEMARVRFKFLDRLVLVPIELGQALWLLPAFAVLGLALALPLDSGFTARYLALLPLLLAVLPLGSVAFPLLLPALPFRAFALKGLVLGTAGLGLAALPGILGLLPAAAAGGAAGIAGLALLFAPPVLIGLPVVIWLAMNFTGATTFTCQTGANREVEKSVIPLIAAAAAGALAGIARVVLALAGIL